MITIKSGYRLKKKEFTNLNDLFRIQYEIFSKILFTNI